MFNKIKFFALAIFFVASANSGFAQFSGGDGTEESPYLISTVEDFVYIQTKLWNRENQFEGIYFRMTNDIVIIDSLLNFNSSPLGPNGFSGHFNGSGHSLSMDTLTFRDSYGYYFYEISQYGTIDSINLSGHYESPLSCIKYNYGKISNCTSSMLFDISETAVSTYGTAVAPFVQSNYGRITHCVNYGDMRTRNETDDYLLSQCFSGICDVNNGTIEYCENYGNIYNATGSAGICAEPSLNGIIRNCINFGNISIGDDTYFFIEEYRAIGGVCGVLYSSLIENCINYGHIDGGKFQSAGGICAGCEDYGYDRSPTHIRNCANYGMVSGLKENGGIVSYQLDSLFVENCLNAGTINGGTATGAIAGKINSNNRILNCLNVSVFPIMLGTRTNDEGDNFIVTSNFYDRQMSGGSGEDVEGETEGRFTSQLTGDTPELRAMLGDGWSYAEGRYPIPLGLENDSLAMLFATPIYLRVISDDNYDHTNLVRNNFTVGTENGVSWSSGDRLSIDGENATILASGSETATASLAGYSFSRSLRLDPITGELVATDCDSYLWNGDEYIASGDYIQVLTASNGCDSIVTLHLTINNSVHYSFTETANSPYIWNGTEYTETGDYTQNFTAANGCDSIVTLHLNILSGISQNGTAEISVFPTPATDILNITSSETISEIEIVNTLGQVVKRIEVNSDNAVCNVEDLKAGVYMVRIYNNPLTEPVEVAVSQRKFIKE